MWKVNSANVSDKKTCFQDGFGSNSMVKSLGVIRCARIFCVLERSRVMSFEFDSSSLADHLRDPADRVQLRKVFFLVLQDTQLRSKEIWKVH